MEVLSAHVQISTMIAALARKHDKEAPTERVLECGFGGRLLGSWGACMTLCVRRNLTEEHMKVKDAIVCEA